MTIDNQSSDDIERLIVYLKSDVSYHATTSTNYIGNIYREVPCPFVVRKGQLRAWKGTIRVPNTHISLNSSMNNSKIINIDYSLVLKIDVSSFSKCKTVKIPVVIGTEKLQESNSNYNSIAIPNYNSITNPNYNSISNVLLRQDSELPPPYNHL